MVMALLSTFVGGKAVLDRLFQLDAVDGHISAAVFAFDANLAAHAKHGKARLSARMRLFQFQNVTDGQGDDVGHTRAPFKGIYLYDSIFFLSCK